MVRAGACRLCFIKTLNTCNQAACHGIQILSGMSRPHPLRAASLKDLHHFLGHHLPATAQLAWHARLRWVLLHAAAGDSACTLSGRAELLDPEVVPSRAGRLSGELKPGWIQNAPTLRDSGHFKIHVNQLHIRMKGQGELLIYLDLDGVVHHEAVYASPRGIYMNQEQAPGRTLFEWVHHLVDALEPFPQVKLVLSSSWCRWPGYSRTLKRLPAPLRQRFVGGTFHSHHHGADPGELYSFTALPRGQQVLKDVLRRQPLDWLALDDDDEDWPVNQTGHLLLCDGELGLSNPATRSDLRARLDQMVQQSGLFAASKA